MVIEIDGPFWFICALLICGWHVNYLRGCRRERLQHLAWWQAYDAKSQARHEEFMRALDRRDADACGWNLDGNRESGQA